MNAVRYFSRHLFAIRVCRVRMLRYTPGISPACFGVHGNNFRFSSSDSVSILASEPLAVTIPEPPLLPESPDLVLNAIGEPTLSSLGLCSYWPSGWYQSILESIHVWGDLPWWGAIATTTVIIRMCLLPFLIEQRRHLGKYSTYMPQMTVLQERLTNARLSGNQLEVMRISKDMQTLMQSGELNPLKSMRLLFIQLPIFLSVFAGIRGMALLPVPSLREGGLFWFADLTVPDPYCILPLLSMGSVLLMLETGAEMSTQQVTPVMRSVMRIFPCVGFFLIMNMPSALLWYWSVSNCISLIQASVLRLKSVRQWLNLPSVPKAPQVEKKRGFVEGFRESYKNSKLIAELEARERLDSTAWQRSAKGAAPRTYAFDPTRSNRQSPVPTKGVIVGAVTDDPIQSGVEIKKKATQQG